MINELDKLLCFKGSIGTRMSDAVRRWPRQLRYLAQTKLCLRCRIGGGRLGQWPAKQQDMWLRRVQHVMHPSGALLNAQIAPFGFRHQMGLGDESRQVIWEDDMSEIDKFEW